MRTQPASIFEKFYKDARDQNQSERAHYVRRSKFKMIFNFSLWRSVPRSKMSEANLRYSSQRKIKKHLNLQEHAH